MDIEVLKISRCNDCPVLRHHHSPATGISCFLDDRITDMDEDGYWSLPDDPRYPDHPLKLCFTAHPQCPLRKSPVQIQFEETNNDEEQNDDEQG